MKRALSDGTADQLHEELSRLQKAEGKTLRRTWRSLYGSEPPPGIRAPLLRCAIAYRIQEKIHGGLRPATGRLLDGLLAEKCPGRKNRQARAGKANPGTVLLRVWGGTTHQVNVEDEGIRYRGKTYRSLSEVARTITGSRWSGPLFFGLRRREGERAHGTP
jgi:hypothetical protein